MVGDPIAKETFSAMGTTPFRLAITDVTTALNTGMIGHGLCPAPRRYRSSVEPQREVHDFAASRPFHGRYPGFKELAQENIPRTLQDNQRRISPFHGEPELSNSESKQKNPSRCLRKEESRSFPCRRGGS